MLIQQGDVLLKKVNLPEGAEVVESLESLILAKGEATGHAHRISSKYGRIVKIGDERFLECKKICSLQHEEHEKQSVYPGIYRITKVQEYDHFLEASRDVAD